MAGLLQSQQWTKPIMYFVFLLAACIVLLAPVWLVEYPPLHDYPNHLASSFVLAHLGDAHYSFVKIYRAGWTVSPYIAQDVALLALQKLVPAELAGRIFLSFCLVMLPLGAWVFVRQANPGHDFLALWGLVIAYNAPLLLGLLSDYLSVALCFAVLGLWLRYLDRPNFISYLALLACVTGLYFTHLMGFLMAGLMMTTYTLVARRVATRLLVSWSLFLPGAVFGLLSRATTDLGLRFVRAGVKGRAFELLGFLRVHSTVVDVAIAAGLVLCVVIALWKNADLVWNLPWVIVGAVVCATYWLVPNAFALDIRVLPFVFLIMPAIAQVGSRTRWLTGVIVVLFLLRTGYVGHEFLLEQSRLAGLARSFDAAPANARVLPIVENDPNEGLLLFSPGHFWAYGMIRRGWLSPTLFTYPNVHPLHLRSNVYVPDGCCWLYHKAPDWLRVQRSYDYIWAYNTGRFSAHFRRIGELVFTDAHLQVYRLHHP